MMLRHLKIGSSRIQRGSVSFVSETDTTDTDTDTISLGRAVSTPERPSLRIKDSHRLRAQAPDGKLAVNALMVESAKLAEILLRAYRNERLTAVENLRLEGFYTGGLSDMARAFRDGTEAELPLGRWRQIYAVDPRFRVHWARTRTNFNATFVSFFEEFVVKEARRDKERSNAYLERLDRLRSAWRAGRPTAVRSVRG